MTKAQWIKAMRAAQARHRYTMEAGNTPERIDAAQRQINRLRNVGIAYGWNES